MGNQLLGRELLVRRRGEVSGGDELLTLGSVEKVPRTRKTFRSLL